MALFSPLAVHARSSLLFSSAPCQRLRSQALLPLRTQAPCFSSVYSPKPDRWATRFVTRAAVSQFDPSIGEILGDVSIFTAAGDPVKFEDLWDQNEGVAVVALLRHFGCICCWELASALKESKAKFDAAGVKLIAVGVGTPDKARILAERLPFPMDCLYADPDRKVKVFSRFEELKKAGKNYTIAATPDDRSSVLQQGGMFIFKGKQLLYARKDEGTGDHTSLDDIFNVCCKVPVT
ncbi:thioredoxin-like protein AAED1, chloroplastic isoform X2 [Humulus lupulus]|uniref:thioredoxin-like protein AAED1, chloroplastic isoform X2 n=1 Tax=Humulus lupulus TaxID=3486 RepID=UPI002B416D1A|nr:thioredoxin-like protein AAED1, chloroplastic isoform X2 [Humulus lupulus]